MKIVREHYLRDDIWCGSEVCDSCKQDSPVLQQDPCIESSLCKCPHYILPDTNVVLHQNKEKAEEAGLVAYTCEEYIQSLVANPELVDRLASTPDDVKYDIILCILRHIQPPSTATGWPYKVQNTEVTAIQNEIESGKIIFQEHLPLSKLQQGIKSGTYLQGTFRSNRDNYLEATVWVHGDTEENKEVLIQGLKNLNRAVHEDVVAVQLLPKDQWVAPSSVVLQDEGTTEDDDEEEKENSLKSVVHESMLKPTGKVVGIIKRNWRPYCGMLSKSQIKEVGVHIADVSHFIRPGNALDQEAASRGTTVYLCEKRIDMVPELLSSNLCSLRSNVERLAFSCIWEMNHNAEIINTKFTKSVINSKASLTYAEAQMRIDDTGMNDEITRSLRGLNRLAKILKKKRIEMGYSDIIVHRLLAVSIGADITYPDLMLFFKSKGIINEEGFILFVKKNAIVVLIPKFGLEGTVFFENKDKPNPRLSFKEEIPTLTVEDTVFRVFNKVKVTISLDASNVQHQKIRMSLVEPVIPGVSVSPQSNCNSEPDAKKPKLES
ncbi:UNVERIFIED_CONTAM: hypothetical protein FKN15_067848 [Acipenser sinensis]